MLSWQSDHKEINEMKRGSEHINSGMVSRSASATLTLLLSAIMPKFKTHNNRSWEGVATPLHIAFGVRGPRRPKHVHIHHNYITIMSAAPTLRYNAMLTVVLKKDIAALRDATIPCLAKEGMKLPIPFEVAKHQLDREYMDNM